MYKDIDLSNFPKEREEKLKSIYRYGGFETFFYRSNLWEHSQRVLWLLEEILPLAQKYFALDPEKARALSLVHDDPEMITGDISAREKANMTQAQLDQLQIEEEKAIDDLSKIYPKEVNGYSYKQLLLHGSKKDCIEARLVSYVDKIDGHCESLRDLFAGNASSLRAVFFYVNALALFYKKYPGLYDLLASKESPLTYLTDVISPLYVETRRYTHLNKPHTKESILIESDFPFYNEWKKIVMKRGGDEGLDWLTKQREFVK